MSSPPNLAAQRIRRNRLILLLGLAALGVVAAITAMLGAARQEALRDAGRTAGNYTAIIEARLDATLRRCDAILLALSRSLPREALSAAAVPAYASRIRTELDDHRLNFEEISGVRVFGADGRMLYSSDDTRTQAADIADRGYFQTLRDDPVRGLVFSEVIASRVTGRDTVVAARAIRDRQGEFLGVLTVGLELTYFEKMFQGLALGPNGLLAIRRSDDFRLVLRWPPVRTEINQPVPPHALSRRMIASGAREGLAEYRGVIDGVVRTFSFRRVESYPFFVLTALAHDDVLAGWRRDAAMLGSAAAALLALMVFLLLRLARLEVRQKALLAGKSESEEMFRHLFEDMNDPILLLKEGNFIDCNAATLKLLGYASKDEFRDCRPAEISPERQPDGRLSSEKAADMIATALRVGYHRFEWVHKRADGTPVPVEVTLTPVTMAGEVVLHTLWRDISERWAAERRLRLLASVFERSGEAILITDRDNRILEVNQAFSLLTGYGVEEVRGQNPRILASGRTTATEFKLMWEKLRESGLWQGEIWDKRKDGSFYPKWLTISAVRNDAGETEYYVGSFTDISERKEAQERIRHLALHDTLTGLPNRYNLQGRLDQALAMARRDATRVALLFIDMDRFKNINDTLGHHVGDSLLQEVAVRLAANVRESDVVARLGGDEFVVVLTGIDEGAAAGVAEKILRALGVTYRIGPHELHTTPSIGVALFPQDGDSAQALMQNADTAMYHAKSAGRNNVQFFTASMNQAAKDRHELESGLHQALERHELELHYQPQTDADGRIVGAEALLRWRSAEFGLVPPLRFIPLAEDSGLILPIGRWVLDTACERLKAWSADPALRHLELAVNVSAREFRQADFVDEIRLVLERSGADPSRLKLELTESLVLDNVEETIQKMLAIRALGIAFSLDDFGTGYSSLAYLTRLPLSQLKIDRAFVLKLPESVSDGIVTQTIITMAAGLGLGVLAEGVETEAQREFLYRHGCRAFQGYLLGRPMELAAFEDFVRSH